MIQCVDYRVTARPRLRRIVDADVPAVVAITADPAANVHRPGGAPDLAEGEKIVHGWAEEADSYSLSSRPAGASPRAVVEAARGVARRLRALLARDGGADDRARRRTDRLRREAVGRRFTSGCGSTRRRGRARATRGSRPPTTLGPTPLPLHPTP